MILKALPIKGLPFGIVIDNFTFNKQVPGSLPNWINKVVVMIKSYFKAAFQNLTRNKNFTVINMAGLAVCPAIFVLIIDHLSTHRPIGTINYLSSFSFVYFRVQTKANFSLKYLLANQNCISRFNAGNSLTNRY
jgi:hypothetical protein